MIKLLHRLALFSLFVTITASHLTAAPRRPPQDAPEMDPSSAVSGLAALGLTCCLRRKRYEHQHDRDAK